MWGRLFFLASEVSKSLGMKKHTLDRSDFEHRKTDTIPNVKRLPCWTLADAKIFQVVNILSPFQPSRIGVKLLLAHVLGGPKKTHFFSQHELFFGWLLGRPTFSPPAILKFTAECFDNGVASKLVNFSRLYSEKSLYQPPRKWTKVVQKSTAIAG